MKTKRKPHRTRFALQANLNRIAALEAEVTQLRESFAALVVVHTLTLEQFAKVSLATRDT